jgi:putative transposase
MSLSFGRQLEMVRREQLISDARHRVLDSATLTNITRDWGSFTEAQRLEAAARYAYVRAIADLPVAHRDRQEFVVPAIAEATKSKAGCLISPPSFRQSRQWYMRWVAAGFDVRALVSNTAACGRRDERYRPWIYEEINAAIDDVYATELKGSIHQTLLRARARIRLRADRERIGLPGLSAHVIGRKVVENEIAKRGAWALLAKREGRSEAERLLRVTGSGPPGEYPLGEVEADHTLVDTIVVENGVVLGRPWLTVLIDRYSRMILGFSISFTPPSWVSVMEALRHAVLPKEDELRRWAEFAGQDFEFDWDCCGSPDTLFVDQGPEFLSASMVATEAALNMRVIQLPRASGERKAKVETLFRSFNHALFHRLDGTTFSNPQKRGKYASEARAIFSLNDLRYLVTRWVVDVHNRQPHSTTGRIPAELWREGMDAVGPKPAPAREIIAPLVGKVVPRKLRRDGVRYNNLRWNSNGFQALRARIGLSCDVLIRIDPLDLRKGYVLDPDTGDWIEGDLLAERDVELFTLRQYDHLREQLEDAKVTDDDYELKLARGSQALWDFVEGRRVQHGVVPKRVADFISSNSRAVEHVHGTRISAADSAEPVGSHVLGDSVLSPPPSPYPPFRDKVLPTPNPYPSRDADGRYPGERVQTPPPVVEVSAPPEEPSETDTTHPTVYPGRRRARR